MLTRHRSDIVNIKHCLDPQGGGVVPVPAADNICLNRNIINGHKNEQIIAEISHRRVDNPVDLVGLLIYRRYRGEEHTVKTYTGFCHAAPPRLIHV